METHGSKFMCARRKINDSEKGVKKQKNELATIPIDFNEFNNHLRKIVQQMLGNVSNDWVRIINRSETESEYFILLIQFLTGSSLQYTIYPEFKNVFNFTRHCNYKDVKVVILGQEPYTGSNGLAYSVNPGIKLPHALENIYKELKVEYPKFIIPKHGDLSAWCKQGVLLLNTVLTVQENIHSSHSNMGWENLTDKIISLMSTRLTHIVFLLWGWKMHKKINLIDIQKHKILCAADPTRAKFLGCNHFLQANNYLRIHGKKEIDWSIV